MRIPTKIKVYGESQEAVLKIVDEIRNLYAPNITQSDLRNSSPSGFHAFLTIYMEGKQ